MVNGKTLRTPIVLRCMLLLIHNLCSFFFFSLIQHTCCSHRKQISEFSRKHVLLSFMFFSNCSIYSSIHYARRLLEFCLNYHFMRLFVYFCLTCYFFIRDDYCKILLSFSLAWVLISLFKKQSIHFQLCFVLLQSRATVMTWASVVRPSVDIVFSETVKWIDTKFY